MRDKRRLSAVGRVARLPLRRLEGGLVVMEAVTPRARLMGLRGLDRFPADHALLIAPCHSVHTFGMRFAVDVAFLDAAGQLVRLAPAVPPGRVLVCLRARSVLETAAGAAPRFLAVLPLLDPQPVEERLVGAPASPHPDA
jgi:uncharacterized membrane protein (UPF0127 family)